MGESENNSTCLRAACGLVVAFLLVLHIPKPFTQLTNNSLVVLSCAISYWAVVLDSSRLNSAQFINCFSQNLQSYAPSPALFVIYSQSMWAFVKKKKRKGERKSYGCNVEKPVVPSSLSFQDLLWTFLACSFHVLQLEDTLFASSAWRFFAGCPVSKVPPKWQFINTQKGKKRRRRRRGAKNKYSTWYSEESLPLPARRSLAYISRLCCSSRSISSVSCR